MILPAKRFSEMMIPHNLADGLFCRNFIIFRIERQGGAGFKHGSPCNIPGQIVMDIINFVVKMFDTSSIWRLHFQYDYLLQFLFSLRICSFVMHEP